MAASLVSPSLYTSAYRISPDFGYPQMPNPVNLRPKTLPLRPLKCPRLRPLCAYAIANADNPRIYHRRGRVGEGAGPRSTTKDRTENHLANRAAKLLRRMLVIWRRIVRVASRGSRVWGRQEGVEGADLMGLLQEGKVEEAVGYMDQEVSLSVLVIYVEGPRSLLVKVWLLAMATVGLVVVGLSYTRPAMNPANAFDGQAPAEKTMNSNFEDDEQ
ncbi:hypothetical protein NL676_028484 [Syzygium grande]|nr:hypothetical protein NL676_028484 [Syzygium grande]